KGARGKRGRECRGHRPPVALSGGLGDDRGLDQEDQQGDRGLRGRLLLGVRRGDRRAHRRSVLPVARRPGQAGRVDRHVRRVRARAQRPAVRYGWLEIPIGGFCIVSPLVLGLAHWIYIGTAGAVSLGGGASVALRFGLAALVLMIPTTLMGGTLPVLTRALTGQDRGLLKQSLGRLYGLNTLGAMTGTAFAGFLLIEFLGVRTSLWITAAINLAIGAAAISLGRRDAVVEPSREPGENPDFPRDHLRTLALVLL